MPPAKADSLRKDWYSISVDTLRSWALLLLLAVGLGGGWLAWRAWEDRALSREAGAAIREAVALLETIGRQPRLGSFKTEYDRARTSCQEAQSEYGQTSFRAALESAQRCRNLLLSVSDALSPKSASGQGQFISFQGEVEVRRGNGDSWEEARARQSLHPGDYVRTGSSGSAEIMFLDGTLYTVRPNTQFIVSAAQRTATGATEQSIEMEYGWVDLNTSNRPSRVQTPGAEANVRQDSEAFVAFDRDSQKGRYGTFRGGLELTSPGGLKREVGPLQQVVQTGDLLSEPAPLPARPEPLEPADNLEVDPDRADQLVLAWKPVPGAAHYALQVSRSHLFVDNVIDAERRPKTRATLGLRGEGAFQWRVAAFDRGGSQGPWSTPRQFRVTSLRAAGMEEKDGTPPDLDLADVKSYGNIFIVGGQTEPGSKIAINGELVKADADGSFTKTVQLTKEGWGFIEIRASDSWGNETVKSHRVFVENP